MGVSSFKGPTMIGLFPFKTNQKVVPPKTRQTQRDVLDASAILRSSARPAGGWRAEAERIPPLAARPPAKLGPSHRRIPKDTEGIGT